MWFLINLRFPLAKILAKKQRRHRQSLVRVVNTLLRTKIPQRRKLAWCFNRSTSKCKPVVFWALDRRWNFQHVSFFTKKSRKVRNKKPKSVSNFWLVWRSTGNRSETLSNKRPTKTCEVMNGFRCAFYLRDLSVMLLLTIKISSTMVKNIQNRQKRHFPVCRSSGIWCPTRSLQLTPLSDLLTTVIALFDVFGEVVALLKCDLNFFFASK